MGRPIFLPGYVELTPSRRKFLELLADGKWHRKFHGIRAATIDLMSELGFVSLRYFSTNREKTEGYIKAKITHAGRILLIRSLVFMDYSAEKPRPII